MPYSRFTLICKVVVLGVVLSLMLLVSGGEALGPGGRPPPGGPPSEAMDACRNKQEGDSCQFTPPGRKKEKGTCRTLLKELACVPEGLPLPLPPRPEEQGERQEPAQKTPPEATSPERKTESTETSQDSSNTLKKEPKQEPTQVKASSPEAVQEVLEAENQVPGKVYAVIIGISKFEDERIPPLRFTVNDAQGFYGVLTDPQYGGVPEEHVKLLLDEEATDRNIKTAIGKWLSRQASEQDTVIIFYSGHGAPDEEGETYWVTYNADIDNLYATGLDNNEIYDMLNRVKSKRMITFLDSCYSAATVNKSDRTRNIQTAIPWDKFEGEGRITISASDGKQLSLEMEDYGHGVFTYHLLEGMKGRADGASGTDQDGVIEIEEVWNYIRHKVTETAKKKGNKQTPVFQGSMTTGIPLTYDVEYLEEFAQRQAQQKQEQQAKLQGLFEQKEISAATFDCAFQMIENGQVDGYLEGLLNGEISPATFSRIFKCTLE